MMCEIFLRNSGAPAETDNELSDVYIYSLSSVNLCFCYLLLTLLISLAN